MLNFLFIMAVLLRVAVLSNGQGSCELFPRNQSILPGTDLKLVFNAPNSSGSRKLPYFSLSKVYWTLNNKRIADNFYHSNSTVASVSIRNFSLPQATVECLLDGIVLCGTVIRGMAVPRKPEIISCIGNKNNFKIKVTCSWHHERNTEDTKYTVYMRRRHDKKTEECKSTEKSCTFSDEVNVLIGESIIITVIAENSARNVSSDEKRYNVTDIIQIDPPDKVHVKSEWIGLVVNWNQISKDEVCQVRSLKEGSLSEHVVDALVADNHNLTKVKPCTTYNISVRCKLPNAVWSKWSRSVTAHTLLNVSEVPFHIWRTKSMMKNNRERKVQLLWKGAPPSCKAFDEYHLFDHTDNFSKRLDPSQNHYFLTLDENTHIISVAALRNNFSLREVFVEIPSTETELNLPAVTNISMSAQNGQINLTWEKPNDSVSGYLSIWNASNNDHRWQQSQETYFSLKGKSETLYTISVIPLYEEGPGSEVTLYSYAQEGKLPEMSNVKESEVTDRKANISWQPILLSQCCAIVVNYTVVYTALEEESREVTVDKDTHSVLLTDLKPSTSYSVHVVAKSATTTSQSAPHTFTTKQYGDFFITVVLACGVGVILLPLLTVVVLLMIKKFLNESFPNPKFSSLSIWSSQPCTTSLDQLPFILDSNSEKILSCQMESEISGLCPASKSNVTSQKTEAETGRPSPSVKMELPSTGKKETEHSLPNADHQCPAVAPLLPQFPYRNRAAPASCGEASPTKPHSLGVKEHLQTQNIQNCCVTTTYVSVNMFEQDSRGEIKRGET